MRLRTSTVLGGSYEYRGFFRAHERQPSEILEPFPGQAPTCRYGQPCSSSVRSILALTTCSHVRTRVRAKFFRLAYSRRGRLRSTGVGHGPGLEEHRNPCSEADSRCSDLSLGRGSRS